MPKIESEKIDCLYRPCSRPAPRGKIESVRTHSEVIEQFDSFSLLKLLFLVRNWHCWSRKAFPRRMTPQSREKTAKTAVFRQRRQAWKVVRSIAAVRQRPRTPRNWRCSFAFFEIFLWHFNKKQRAEVILRLSRPVSCKNQENGSGKRWSVHAPLKSNAAAKLCTNRWTPNSLHFAHAVHFAHGGQNLLLSFDCRSDWFWGFCTLPDQNLPRHKTSVLLTRLFQFFLCSNFRLSKEMHMISPSCIEVHVNCTQVTLVPLTKLLQIPVFYSCFILHSILPCLTKEGKIKQKLRSPADKRKKEIIINTKNYWK